MPRGTKRKSGNKEDNSSKKQVKTPKEQKCAKTHETRSRSKSKEIPVSDQRSPLNLKSVKTPKSDVKQPKSGKKICQTAKNNNNAVITPKLNEIVPLMENSRKVVLKNPSQMDTDLGNMNAHETVCLNDEQPLIEHDKLRHKHIDKVMVHVSAGEDLDYNDDMVEMYPSEDDFDQNEETVVTPVEPVKKGRITEEDLASDPGIQRMLDALVE